jgi:hypothetical protein
VVVVLVAELDVLAQIMLGHVMPPSGRILAVRIQCLRMNSTTSTMTAMRIIVPNPINMNDSFECCAARAAGRRA